MAKIKSIQSGQKTLAAASQSDTITITAVVLANSFLRISWSGGGDRDARHATIYAQLTATTTISIEKYGTGGTPQDCVIEWQVIEFESGEGVDCQQGTYATTSSKSSPIDVTISAVTLADTFPILHYFSGVNFEVNGADCMRTELTSTTNLRIMWDRAVSHFSGASKFGWQIVEIDDCDVNLYTEVVTGTSDTETITSVDTSKTMLITSFGSNAASGALDAREYFRAELTNSTTITYSSNTSSAETNTFNTWVVEFSDDTTVSRYTASFGATDLSDAVTISISDTANAWVNATNCICGGNGCENNKNSGYDNEFALIRGDIDSTSQLTATRYDDDGATADWNFEIIEPDTGGSSIPQYMHHYTKNQG